MQLLTTKQLYKITAGGALYNLLGTLGRYNYTLSKEQAFYNLTQRNSIVYTDKEYIRNFHTLVTHEGLLALLSLSVLFAAPHLIAAYPVPINAT